MLKGAPGCSEQIGGAPYAEGWQTSVGSCGSSPALPSQRPPRPGEPLFERSSHRGGGDPVAHGLPQPRRQIAGMQAAARCPHHGHPPLHAGPHHPHGSCHQSCSRIRGWALPSSTWQCTASRISLCSPPGCLPPCEWRCRRRCRSTREPALTHSLHKLLQFLHRTPNHHG
jgi:hypothetical protein